MCPCCCCYWRTASETSALDGVVQPKRLCLAAYPISAARKRRSGMNRIGHPDWVKLCVELNCAPNQNTFCYILHIFFVSFSNNLSKSVKTFLTQSSVVSRDLYIDIAISPVFSFQGEGQYHYLSCFIHLSKHLPQLHLQFPLWVVFSFKCECMLL